MSDRTSQRADKEIKVVTLPSELTDRGQQAGASSGLAWWQRMLCQIVKAGPTPKHVGFIMDGNRRFARDRGMEVAIGHRLGYDKLEEVNAHRG